MLPQADSATNNAWKGQFLTDNNTGNKGETGMPRGGTFVQ